MKLETFFEKYDQIADAPDAVAKMRELVLRFATAGLLTDQRSSDGTGTALLEQIKKAREELLNDGTTRQKIADRAEEAGDAIEIPHNWNRTTISEICYLLTGATPSRQVPQYFGGDIRWLVSGDINQRQITECEGRITQKGLASSNCKIIPAQSVMIALNGQGKTRATVAMLRVPATCNQSLVAMVPYSLELLVPEYVFWNLRGRYMAIRDITGQKQRRGLNMGLVGSLSIPIPPLAEQKRIVAKVDELMALCDRLEAQQQERDARQGALARASLTRFANAPTPANLNFLFHSSYHIQPSDLRKSILTLAVHGKLVPQDPSEGAREISTVGTHLEFQNGYAFKSGWFKESGIRLCRNANVGHGSLDWADTKFVDDQVAEEFERFALTEGDIVLSLDRPLITSGLKIARIGREDLPCLLLQRVAKPTPKHEGIDLSYAFMWFHSSEFIDTIDPGRSNGVPHISTRQVQALPLVLPPLAEQRRIVAKVDQLMALVDELETQIAESRSTAKYLLEALVAELTAAPTSASKSRNNLTDLQATPEFKRAALAAKIVGRMCAHPTFGQVKLQKVIYLAEYIAQLEEIDSHPKRHVNGPYDPKLIDQVEIQMKELEWYKAVPRKNVGKAYEPLPRAEKAQSILTKLWPDKAPIIEKLINQMQTWKTERCERFATLYAAWNDLLIWGEKPADQAILDQVLNHWHPDKKKILLDSWKESLAWIRDNGYAPTGFGRSTSALPNLELF